MFELPLIKALQSLSNPFFDYLAYGVTQIGDELFFMALALVIYWCVDKRFGFKLINIYLLSSCVVEGAKMLFSRPRPYTYTSEGIRDISNGISNTYSPDAIATHADSMRSMPSGHTHSVANLGAQLSLQYRKKWIYFLSLGVVVLVALTRMYLGQHFLTDVLVGAVMGIGLGLGMSFLFELLKDREHYIVFVALPLCLILAIVFAALNPSGMSDNVYKVLGVYPALTMGYYAEKRFVRLNVRTRWYKNLIKIFLGGILVLVFLEGLKFPMAQVTDLPFVYYFLRYFLVGIMATIGAMELFKLFKLYDIPPSETFAIPADYIEIDMVNLKKTGKIVVEAAPNVTVEIEQIGDADGEDEPPPVVVQPKSRRDKRKAKLTPAPEAIDNAIESDDAEPDPLDRTLEEIAVEPVADTESTTDAEPVTGAEPAADAEPVADTESTTDTEPETN